MTFRDQSGLTLAETVIALAVLGLVLPAIVSIFYLLMSVPLRGAGSLVSSLEAGQAVEVISRDGRSAIFFATPTAPPDYGTFSWTDYAVVPPAAYTVTYYYDSSARSLVRQETVDSGVSSRHIARNVASYGDVAFVPVGDLISVTVRSTITSPVSATGVVTKEAATLVMLRAEEAPSGVIFNPIQDSYVNQNAPNANHGTGDNLQVRSTTTDNPDANARTFAQFDLSSIPGGSSIGSAKLRLYMYQAPSASRSYDAHRVTGYWTETGITWSNQPAVAASATSTKATGTTANAWLEWDMTADVQAFVNGTQTNYGWRIKDQVESDAGDFESRFRSKEYAGATYAPQLVVDYAAVTPTPSPTPVGTPTSASFGASADSTLKPGAPNTNFGADTIMDLNDDRDGVVRFNISSIPPGSTIISAMLNLTATSVGSSTSQKRYSVHSILVNWDESTVTWNNPGSTPDTHFANIPTSTTLVTDVGSYSWDVKADVAAFVGGSASNFGWRAIWTSNLSGANTQVSFGTKENATVGNRPSLTVVYAP